MSISDIIIKSHKFLKNKIGNNANSTSHAGINKLIPNTEDIVVQFNYFYAFRYIPQELELYNANKVSISSVIDIPSIIKRVPKCVKVASKIEYMFANHNTYPFIKTLTILIPNTKSISEVELALIIYNEKTNKALYYTLEISLDNNYAICVPKSNGEHCLLTLVKTPQEFTSFVSEQALPQLLQEDSANEDVVCENSIVSCNDGKVTVTLCSDNKEKGSPSQENTRKSTTGVNFGVKQTWPLLEFARLHGKMKVAPFVDSETGKTFKICAFIDSENNVTLVAFSSKLGELTPKEISAQKHELQVVQLESGNYKLCRKGKKIFE